MVYMNPKYLNPRALKGSGFRVTHNPYEPFGPQDLTGPTARGPTSGGLPYWASKALHTGFRV